MVRSVPNPQTWVPGFVNDTDMNREVRDALKYLLDPPRAEPRQTATQNLTTTVWTDITFTSEDYDQSDDPGHDIVTNTARYTAPASGWYGVDWIVALAAIATSALLSRLSVNGTAVNNSRVTAGPVSPAASCVSGSMRVFLNAGDYVTVQGRQDTGGTVATVASADTGSRMSVRFEGK